MRNFAIIEPFSLNWKYVAPRDFETLEYFISPRISLVFQHVTNGKNVFKIGAYILGANNVPKFMAEIMPQRSAERIEKAFKNDDISAFFSLEDAKGLQETFQQEQFICRKVVLLLDGVPVDLAELAVFEDEFDKLVKDLIELKVVHADDFKTQGDNIRDTITEIREEVARGFRKQQAKREQRITGLTKRELIKRAIIGVSLLTFSGSMAFLSKKVITSGGWKKVIGGALIGTVSIIGGIAGKQVITTVVEHVQKGLILNYG